MTVITRFSPSPTGALHLGSYRTAIFNYLYAKKMGGKFLLRIEDTDRARSKTEYLEDILENLKWLEVIPDEIRVENINFITDERTGLKYILQSARVDRHREILKKMIDLNLAYTSLEEAKDGSGRNLEIIRFRNKNKVVSWNDLVRGRIKMDTTDLGDFIIARNINDPLYHFAVVLDDFDAGVTHIIRGEDHIANTPRQILIKEALEEIFKIKKDFIYAHLPLVLGLDKLKLSKRRGAKSLSEYRKLGYLKEAMLNFVALIGWHPGQGEEQEIFSREELIRLFSLEKVHKAGAILNEKKFNWFNKEYIKRQEPEEQLAYCQKFLPESEKYNKVILEKMLKLILERISYYGELKTLSEAGEFTYILSDPIFDQNHPVENLIWKESSKEKTIKNLQDIRDIFERCSKDFSKEEEILENIWQKIYSFSSEAGKGEVLWPLRYALSGKDKSPDPKSLLKILGYEISLRRINYALQKLLA